MENPLVLVFDVGTQSVRAALVNKKGDIVAIAKDVYEQPYYSLQPNWAEQRPDFYFEHMCAVCQRLKDTQIEAFNRISAVAVSVFRDTTVCLDENGHPVRDSILWMDQRQTKNPKPIPAAKRALFKAVGQEETIDFVHKNSVCNWIVENEPENWAKTKKYVVLSVYFIYRLTGRMADSPAALMAKYPFDYKNRTWDKNGLSRCLYDISNDVLCEIVESGDVIGKITPEASRLTGLPEGLPLIATGADKQCETLGLSVVKTNQAALSFGTSCTVSLANSKYYEPFPFMPAYSGVPKGIFNPELQLLRGYWMLTWFKNNFAEPEVEAAKALGCSAEDLLNKHLNEIPAGCDGLMVLPHWTPTLSTPGARGAMIGFSDVHTKYHVYRAIIEGLNFGLMEGMHTMEKRGGQKITELYLGGGGSRSDEICQITANMFGLPLHRIQTNESTALGAAICCFVSLGEFGNYNEAIDAMVHVKDTFQPDMQEHAVYQNLYEQVFIKYYGTVDPLHRKLREFTKKKD